MGGHGGPAEDSGGPSERHSKSGRDERRTTEERKVVTTLFCDLVGYTSHSEAADHELIDELVGSYNGLAKHLVESHGGVVEKFIGDAVLAVFGFPQAHDDDAERAIRVGLALIEKARSLTWPDGDAVQVRIGVNSGETYLHTDVDPSSGDTFLTGDTVNTAARLETAAPPGTVVVGELTHTLTERTILYEELEPLTLKGKRSPVRAWVVRGTKGRNASAGYAMPLVGRDAELGELERLYALTVAENRSRIALVTGEPGIGKSRLVAEFGHWLDETQGHVTWREGRCLPYGDGVSLWALAEIVKAHLGVLDTDSEAVAAGKLERALPSSVDAEWIAGRLRPLLGLEASGATREQSFSAWRLFLEHVAAAGPAVLVFEDLHWADEMMLAFVSELGREVSDAPLFILGTSRNVLFERQPDFAREAERLDLGGLAGADLSALVAAHLATPVTPPEIESLIFERCAGNPLYAEEYVRLLNDRGLLERRGGTLRLDTTQDVPLPDSLQAVIAARLDTLAAHSKAVLMDAAVVGRTFWTGALQAISGERSRASVEEVLSGLCDTELIRSSATSTMKGEDEYAFWHVLARDVAYAELPLLARAGKHAAAGAWLEEKSGDRALDIADVLAHHYATALGLARARGAEDLAASLVDPAIRGLSLAGKRSERLDIPASIEYYRRGLELAGEEHPDHWKLLKAWASLLLYTGDYERAYEELTRVVDGFRAIGERRQAADTLMYLATAANMLSRSADVASMMDEAVALLEGDEPSPELVSVLTCQADVHMMRCDWEGMLRLCDEALMYAEQLGMHDGDDEPIQALSRRGMARCFLGDTGGLQDTELAAQRRNSPFVLLDLAGLLFHVSGPRAAIAKFEEAVSAATRRGDAFVAEAASAGLVGALQLAGDWDRALAASFEAEDTLAGRTNSPYRAAALMARICTLIARGCRLEADVAYRDVKSTQTSQDADGRNAEMTRAIIAQAEALLADAHDDPRGATDALERLLSHPDMSEVVDSVPEAVRIALRSDDRDLALRLSEVIDGSLPLGHHAQEMCRAELLEADRQWDAGASRYAVAAAAWKNFGVPHEQGLALLGRARCLLALGRRGDAAASLDEAIPVFDGLGAGPALDEARLLADRTHSGADDPRR
jgi:class 3 adenylate cyclase/tetratricopeptide (TPR) repeat protein